MRIHCKVVVIALCFGVFLLLYFLGGNAADDPLLKEVVDDDEEGSRKSFPTSPPKLGRDVASKFVRKSSAGVGVRAEEPLRGRKEGKAINRGASVNAKSKPRSNVARPVVKRTRAEEVMHLAVVACGNRLDETLTMVKSALLFSFKKIKFHIFAEDPLAPKFEERLKQWPRAVATKFQYNIYPITFSVGNADEWKKLFKPCAAQRLFLPVILKDVDSLLYVDTDVLFLRPMDDIWSLLKSFNSTQLAAMAPEHEVPKIGWYSRFARHPFYGVTGVNSGVMLMNLTRIRSTLFKNSMISNGLSWEDLLHPLYQKYKNHITWGDQDLLNIIFHYNPGNSRLEQQPGFQLQQPDVGIKGSEPSAELASLFPFEDNMFQSLFYPIQTKFLDTVNTLCGRIPQVFLKQIEKTMKKMFEEKVVHFDKKAKKEACPLLEQFLCHIAKTGETMVQWSQFKNYFLFKLEKVMDDFRASAPEQRGPANPNVESIPFEDMKERILKIVKGYNGIPFTIQRLCELLTEPKRNYTGTDKFLRGVEKNVMVVSCVHPTSEKNGCSAVNRMNGVMLPGNTSAFTERLKVNGPGTPRPLNRPKVSLANSLAANGLPDSTDNKDLNTEQEGDKDASEVSASGGSLGSSLKNKHPDAEEDMEAEQQEVKRLKFIKEEEEDEDEEDEEEEQDVDTLRPSHATCLSKEAEAMVQEDEEEEKSQQAAHRLRCVQAQVQRQSRLSGRCRAAPRRRAATWIRRSSRRLQESWRVQRPAGTVRRATVTQSAAAVAAVVAAVA
ncbi:hypothetical protein INR49_022975 [Caranx melampygus]|nr:hypothetical protein INR49_022975 [Caranx melampygus]